MMSSCLYFVYTFFIQMDPRANYYFMKLNAFFEFQIFYAYTGNVSSRVSDSRILSLLLYNNTIDTHFAYPCISVNF